MDDMKQNIFTELKWRGLVYQHTPEVYRALESQQTLYLGFDPTGSDFHIGHLLGLITLKRFLQYGHRIIILVGGGTSLIGDPSGKNIERPLISQEEVENNVKKFHASFKQFFDIDGDHVRLVDNYEWLSQVRLIEFLRDVGKYINLNSMLDKEMINTRLVQGISYAEFTYQLMQAYDYMILYERYGCTLQIGGSDQWGNIIQGVELVRKKLVKEVHALSFPLIVNPQTGRKFGKTESGQAIWLDAKKTHPFHFYQFLVNVEDSLAPVLLRYFSFKSQVEIEEVERAWESKREERSLQKALAHELTSLLHGREIADQIEKITQILFERGQLELDEKDAQLLVQFLPNVAVSSAKLSWDSILLDLKLASSKSEARRLQQQNAVKTIKIGNQYILVRKGKREYGIVNLI